MNCNSQVKCFNCKIIDFRDRLYWKFESEWNIQSLQDTTNRLRLIHDGYLQDPELEEIIQRLENYTNKQIEHKTTNINELYQLETQLLTLVEGCKKHPPKMEG